MDSTTSQEVSSMLEADINPYGVDSVVLLESEIHALMAECEKHRTMSKTTKGNDFHKKMLKVKEPLLERLISQHPDGEEFLYDMET